MITMKRKHKKAIPIIQAIIVTILFHVAFFVLFTPTSQEIAKKIDNTHRFVMSLDINKLPAPQQILLRKFLYYNNPLDLLDNANSVLRETQLLTKKYSTPEEYKFNKIVINDSYNYQKYIPFKVKNVEPLTKKNNKFIPLQTKTIPSLQPNNYKSNGKITAIKKQENYFISDINGNQILEDKKFRNNIISLIKKNHVSSSLFPTKIVINTTKKGFQPQVKITQNCGKTDLDIAAFKIATANAQKILDSKNLKQLSVIFNWNALIKEVTE